MNLQLAEHKPRRIPVLGVIGHNRPPSDHGLDDAAVEALRDGAAEAVKPREAHALAYLQRHADDAQRAIDKNEKPLAMAAASAHWTAVRSDIQASFRGDIQAGHLTCDQIGALGEQRRRLLAGHGLRAAAVAGRAACRQPIEQALCPLLSSLCDNPDGFADVSVGELQRVFCCSPDAVQAALQKLETLGLYKVTRLRGRPNRISPLAIPGDLATRGVDVLTRETTKTCDLDDLLNLYDQPLPSGYPIETSRSGAASDNLTQPLPSGYPEKVAGPERLVSDKSSRSGAATPPLYNKEEEEEDGPKKVARATHEDQIERLVEMYHHLACEWQAGGIVLVPPDRHLSESFVRGLIDPHRDGPDYPSALVAANAAISAAAEKVQAGASNSGRGSVASYVSKVFHSQFAAARNTGAPSNPTPSAVAPSTGSSPAVVISFRFGRLFVPRQDVTDIGDRHCIDAATMRTACLTVDARLTGKPPVPLATVLRKIEDEALLLAGKTEPEQQTARLEDLYPVPDCVRKC